MSSLGREECRRLSLPTLIRELQFIGNLRSIVRNPHYVTIVIESRTEEPIALNFSDEDTATDEGFRSLIEDSADTAWLVLPCMGTGCGVGCGCQCAVDFGYYTTSTRASGAVCHGKHDPTFPQQRVEAHEFTLRTTKKAAEELNRAYMNSLIQTLAADRF